MTDIERLLIERACERLMTEYTHLIDHGKASRVCELFSEDGVFHSPNAIMTGRAEIEAGFMRREKASHRRSRHVCTNVLIDVIDKDNATGVVYLTLHRHDDRERPDRVRPSEVPEIVGEYRDTFVRTVDGWRFSRREIGVDFARGAKP